LIRANKILTLAVGWLLLLSILTLTPGNKFPKEPDFIPHLDKMVHFVLYFTLSTLWCVSIGLNLHKKLLRNNIALVLLIGITLAVVMEYLQKFIPYRSFDLWDMTMNVSGILFGITCFLLFHRKYSNYL
jgi:VanZ family protein